MRFHANLALLSMLLASVTTAGAQESPAQWMARIFDPASLSIQPFPGGALNRKLSVDSIQLERGGDKRIAVYIMPLEQLKAAADHYSTQLGVPPRVTGEGSQYVVYAFDFTGAGATPKYKGLKVQITRSPFVDSKGQVTMEYQPAPK